MKNYYFKFEGKTHERIKNILFWILLVFFGAFIYAYVRAWSDQHSDTIKYLNDALILEKAYTEAVASKNPLFHRYSYYCANSYKDYGSFEDAIRWYKITLKHETQWEQEKYTSCLYIYNCYNKDK